MRRYDTIFIIDPDLAEEGRVPVFDRLKVLIPAQGGALIAMDEWGTKKLAYPIKEKPRGYYVRADYCGNGAVVDEMERFFRIDDRVLKYMTVQTESNADAERLLAEIAEAKSSEAEAKSSEAEAAPTTESGGTETAPPVVAGETETAPPAVAGETETAPPVVASETETAAPVVAGETETAAPADSGEALAEPTPDEAPEPAETKTEEVTAEEPKTETTEEAETHGPTTT